MGRLKVILSINLSRFSTFKRLSLVRFSLINTLSIIIGNLIKEPIRDQLVDKVYEQRNEAQENTHEPLSEGKTLLLNPKNDSPESHDEDLSTNDQYLSNNEKFVRFDANKDPNLVINLSSSEHVENLEEYEQVEDERQVSGVGDALNLESSHQARTSSNQIFFLRLLSR